jgi:hypothetical protein
MKGSDHAVLPAGKTSAPSAASGFRGVVQQGQKCYARIQADGKDLYLGSYDTAEAAARAYDAKARELTQQDGKTRRLNFADVPATDAAGNIVSRYRGVSWSSGARRWRARVTWRQDDKRHEESAGMHDSEEEAARAYDAKAIELLGLARARSRLNFPPAADSAQLNAAAQVAAGAHCALCLLVLQRYLTHVVLQRYLTHDDDEPAAQQQ